MASWLAFDSTTPGVIPRGAFLLGYANGEFATPRGQLAAHPRRAMVDVFGDAWSAASVLQVDGTPAEVAHLTALAPEWCHNRNTFRPDTATVYCNHSQLAALEAAFRAAGDPDPWVILATLDGTACLDQVPGGWGRLAGVQAWGADLLGFHADVTLIVSEDWYRRHGG